MYLECRKILSVVVDQSGQLRLFSCTKWIGKAFGQSGCSVQMFKNRLSLPLGRNVSQIRKCHVDHLYLMKIFSLNAKVKVIKYHLACLTSIVLPLKGKFGMESVSFYGRFYGFKHSKEDGIRPSIAEVNIASQSIFHSKNIAFNFAINHEDVLLSH